ncbi:hypothetical protein EJD97_002766 [Solanum chilense]|uniref:Uncharacterized protein n=1 Tax=Solanum chilense TaxID=4083 RepID=A0A6N2C0Q4_SOLCI|nr:hypothetical protein EJD97_002766 [Solanum chilense]
MAVMIARFMVDFAWLLQAVMHERVHNVPIWNVDQLKTPQGTVDVELIRDEANELAPRRGPRPELPLLFDDLADTVAQARTAAQVSTDTTPVESISGSSTAPSSSRTAPLPALVPLMQKSIIKSEELLQRKMVQFTERKIAEAAVDSLRADINTILEARVLESEAPSVDPAKDNVLAALFTTSKIPPPPPRESAKRCRGRAEDEARARKKERGEMEAARRASLAEEAAHQLRATELAARASSSRTVDIEGGTTDGAVVAQFTILCWGFLACVLFPQETDYFFC